MKPDHNSNHSTDDKVLVRVEGVSKKFCRSLKQSLWYGVRDIAAELNPFARSVVGEGEGDAGNRLPTRDEDLRQGEFWALRDVSFELRRGECLGLIGHNGAGKTTLLKMLNGLIKPDTGRIEMRGRVGALIALGAGFNPILTGRENIYVNGAVLGLSKREIDEKYDEIVDFADIGEFIDSPVQSYSSGMQVRLGFAVATALQPDVLILDEVLAVGDAVFRSKCYQRIVSMKKNAAVIFVSHSMEQVSRICNKTLVMWRGKTLSIGDTTTGITTYEQVNDKGRDIPESFLSLQDPITAFSVEPTACTQKTGAPFKINLQIASNARIKKFQLRVYFYSSEGRIAGECHFFSEDYEIAVHPGNLHWTLIIHALPLKNGVYYLSINVIDLFGNLLVWSYKKTRIQITNAFAGCLADCHMQPKLWKQIVM